MKLKAYVANIGMSMRDFAKYIDITPGRLSIICRSNTFPSKKTADKIFEATSGEIKMYSRKEWRQMQKALKEKERKVS